MILDRFRLDGRVALITGAGKGIGAGIARAYAEAGAELVLAARTLDDVEAVRALFALAARGLPLASVEAYRAPACAKE